ncbi:MAG: hypothetical protein Q8N36_06190, partial [bacterium]|nr:hypothetical protein [bacterium]
MWSTWKNISVSSATSFLWDEILGHDAVGARLRQILQQGRVGHAYLLFGPKGIGKFTIAKTFATTLLCSGHQAPCGRCNSCQKSGAGLHPDIKVIIPDGNSFKIEQIRELIKEVPLYP